MGSRSTKGRQSARGQVAKSDPSKPTSVALVHMGCARNLIDSELILARMAEEGLMVSGAVEEADIAVLNTCSFIGPAREESENAIHDLVARKKRGELRAVVVAGCLVQRYTHTLEGRFPEVDLFAEISDYSELARSIVALDQGQKVPRYLAAGGLRAPERDAARLLATPGSYAYLRISHGCDHTCSFCAIPSIRGPHRSKTIDDLKAETRDLIDAGVKELVLVAEDSTAWGRDIGQELPDLVEALADIDGDHRLRVMYAYPNNFPWRLTELLRDHPRVIPYLDIPVQHIATPVLRSMRRAGSGEQVRATLERLRSEVPGITLRTTLLVGFPGETEAHVDELVSFVEEAGLGRMGAFPYSHEEGTPAHELANDVPPGAAEGRLKRVLEARDRALRASQETLIGSEIEVLVDEVRGGWVLARTERDAPEVDPVVAVTDLPPGAIPAVGDRLNVIIDRVDEEGNLVARPKPTVDANP
ncbi:MAG: ribosomal protein S12 methylthiotransferase [Planctomycetota bacterium]|jgi:ribosomal protein S12 methylthiotransferase